MNVAVVGCGVVGASVGWHLARTGAEVTWFEQGAVGAGTSGSSLAWVNASSFMSDRNYFSFRWAAMEEWSRVAEVLGEDGWWNPSGHLQWRDAAGAEELMATYAEAQELGYPVELLDVAEARRLEPEVRFPDAADDDAAVAHFPIEGWIDPRRAAERFVAAGRELGASARAGNAVTAIDVVAGRVRGVRVDDGERVAVDAVVNCAGPAAAAVAAMVGRTLPLSVEPGLVVRVDAGAPLISRVLHAPGVELRPDGDRRVLVHSGSFDTAVAGEVTGDELTSLGEQLLAVGAGAVPRLADATAMVPSVGRRPIPGDRRPSVGWIDAIEGYYEAVMHSGVTLAAVVGQLLAALIIDGDGDGLADYQPGRFG